VRQIKQQLPAL